MINLRKLADQQMNQRALKIKNRTLKQTNDIKLAEILSPINKKLEEPIESTQKLCNIIKESKSLNETPQLVFENTPIKQQIEKKEGVIYDVELENTLKNLRGNTGFFKTKEYPC